MLDLILTCSSPLCKLLSDHGCLMARFDMTGGANGAVDDPVPRSVRTETQRGESAPHYCIPLAHHSVDLASHLNVSHYFAIGIFL